jgi:transcriptional regulator with XRE-family HTH domain
MNKNTKELSELNMWMGKRLLQLRVSAGVSQNEFARQLEIARMTLVNIENGIQTITNWVLFNSATILGVQVSEFFPALDKKGNFITQDEYRKLAEAKPNDYPVAPAFTLISHKEIEKTKQARENKILANRKAKETGVDKKATKTLKHPTTKKAKTTRTGSVVRQLS